MGVVVMEELGVTEEVIGVNEGQRQNAFNTRRHLYMLKDLIGSLLCTLRKKEDVAFTEEISSHLDA